MPAQDWCERCTAPAPRVSKASDRRLAERQIEPQLQQVRVSGGEHAHCREENRRGCQWTTKHNGRRSQQMPASGSMRESHGTCWSCMFVNQDIFLSSRLICTVYVFSGLEPSVSFHLQNSLCRPGVSCASEARPSCVTRTLLLWTNFPRQAGHQRKGQFTTAPLSRQAASRASLALR